MGERRNEQLDQDAFRLLVRQTVHETLVGLGLDMREPNELQADLYYLRKIRSGSEDMAKVLRRSAITLSFTTTLYLVWEAIRRLVLSPA